MVRLSGIECDSQFPYILLLLLFFITSLLLLRWQVAVIIITSPAFSRLSFVSPVCLSFFLLGSLAVIIATSNDSCSCSVVRHTAGGACPLCAPLKMNAEGVPQEPIVEAPPPREDVAAAGGDNNNNNNNSNTNNNTNNNSINNSGSSRIFEELLDAEVSVNPTKLREASRAGIPPLYRSTVYRYLLGVAFVDKSREMTLERMQEKDFEQMEATFSQIVACDGKGRIVQPLTSLTLKDTNSTPLISRSESRFANGYRCSDRHSPIGYVAWFKAHTQLKYLPRFVGNHVRRQRMESAWRALHVAHSEATPDEVEILFELALAFESVHSTARDIYFSVESLYHLLTHHDNVLQNVQCLQRTCGTFLMLFRATNFPLYRHFVMEGVTVVDWLPGMLTTLLAGRLHKEDLLRLWDTYLADALEHLSFPLHLYVCLAILSDMTEVLIECEKSGIIERLRHLPRIKVSRIIQKAISLKESVFSKGLL